MRETELKANKAGSYDRNIGFHRAKSGRRPTQPKFCLGKNKRVACERLNKIAAIWRRIEQAPIHPTGKPAWDELSLKIAKAIAAGKAQFLVEAIQEDAYQYAQFVEGISTCFPEITIRPSDAELYRAGKSDEQDTRAITEDLEVNMLTLAADIKTAVLEGPGNDKKYIDLLGDQTLHEALDAYSVKIAKEKFDVSEAAVNDTGKTKQNMIKQIKSYVANTPLSSLDDVESVDRVFGTLRQRPITHRYKTPMKAKSASNLIGELVQFFDLLHTSKKWSWREPADYHRISHRPLVLEGDEVAEAEDIPTYSIKQIGTLLEYATPLERLLVLLAINCGFGADQIGRLRIAEVKEKNGVHYIRRVRKKKRVQGMHRLFDATFAGIKWATKGREELLSGHVIVNRRGNPLWRKTKGGNRARDIPNAWYRLLDRIQEDIDDFPRYGFNTLRDTSANLIRRIAGAELASIHLTHRHQSRDRNLRRYTNPPWKELFKAQRKLERKLATVLETEGDPWADREHQYLSQGQIKKMKSLAEQGTPVSQIANEVGVAKSTVYRWLGSRKQVES
ncbi:helix-turn-helix domain-containing protein [Rosistilla oblonga]|uniref:helix-turn-helix domain-containing protein n=1 Tax=Rosistilla oblonga TaxID=2527990 RepID=UPI003A983E22